MNQTRRHEVSTRRPRRTKAAWVEEVKKWRASGQTAEQYAREHGLHEGTLAAWSSKLHQEAGAGAARTTGRARRARAAFVPAVVVAGRGAERGQGGRESDVVEVVLLNGRRVRVTAGFEPDALARLLEIAEGGAGC